MLPFAVFACGGPPWEKGRDSNINCLLFHLECPLPFAQEQVLEGLSAHVLSQILFLKPHCSEKTSNF